MKIDPIPKTPAPLIQIAAAIHTAFRIEGVIDWLELKVTLQAPEEFKWVRTALRKLLKAESLPDAGLHVEGEGAPVEHRYHSFRFRLHDVPANSPSMLLRILDGLASWRPFAERPSITAIEISLDFWVKGKTDAHSLISTTKTLQGMVLGDGSVPRQTTNDRTAYSLDDYYDILDGASVYIGNHRAAPQKGICATPYAWRTYFKRTDRQKSLPPTLHRSRVEITLQGQALQDLFLTNPYELASYNFQSLAKFFRFRQMLPLSEILKQLCEDSELYQSTKAMLKAELAALKATRTPTPPETLKRLRFRVGLLATVRANVIKLYEEGAHPLTWHATGWSLPDATKKVSIRANKCRSTKSYDELNDRATKALKSLGQRMKKA